MIGNIIPTTGPETLKRISVPLDRRARFEESERRLSSEAEGAKAAIAKTRAALDEADGKLAVADADGDDKARRATAATCGRLRRELGEAEETLAQKERGRRGLARERDVVDDEIAAAYPD